MTLVWSVSSGKRLILADGQEIHYSNSRNALLDFSWTMRGNHVLKIVAYASPPISPTPGWRQYDFFVDGQSFFTFPKVYRLGLAPNDPRALGPRNPTRLAERGERSTSGPPGSSGNDSEIANLEAPSNTQEEEAYLQEAIRQSLEDGTPAPSATGSSGGEDLLDFDSPAPAPAAGGMFGAPAALPPSTTAASYSAQAPAVSSTYGYAYGQQPPNQAPLPALPAPVSATNGFAPGPVGAATFPASSAPGPAPVGVTPFGAAPVMAPNAPVPITTGGFETAPAQPYVTPQAQQTPSTIGFASPSADFSGFTPTPGATPQDVAQPAPAPEPAVPPPAPAVPPPAQDPAQPTLTMNSLSGEEGLLAGNTQTSGSMADQAYAKLVNMDAFTLGNPSQSAPKRDNPFENAATNSVIGGTQSLADMQSRKESSGSTTAKEVMKAPAPGALVVSSTQNGNWGGQYGGMQQQPMAGGMQPMQQQPMYGGGMQQQPQPMYGGGMQQQPQQMYGGGTQQQGFGGQQPPPLGQMGGMGGPPPLQQPFGGGFGQTSQMGQQPFGGYGQQPAGGYQ